MSTKSSEAKSSSHSTSTSKLLSEVLLEASLQAKGVDPVAAALTNPVAAQTKAAACMAQLREAAEDRTPSLLFYEGAPGLTWIAVLQGQSELVLTATNKPGGLSTQPEVPKEAQISTGIETGEAARRRVAQVIESFAKLQPAKAAELRHQVFGERQLPTSKAGWEIELASTIKSIKEMNQAPKALLNLTPRLEAVPAAVTAARPQRAGRPSTAKTYSAEAIQTAVALEVLLSELQSWAGAEATDDRNGKFVRILSPKRGADAKPAEPAKPVAPAAPAEGQTAAPNGTDAAHPVTPAAPAVA